MVDDNHVNELVKHNVIIVTLLCEWFIPVDEYNVAQSIVSKRGNRQDRVIHEHNDSHSE